MSVCKCDDCNRLYAQPADQYESAFVSVARVLGGSPELARKLCEAVSDYQIACCTTDLAARWEAADAARAVFEDCLAYATVHRGT